MQLWGVLLIVTLFVAPFLSMRLFAEEKRNKTFELLMTTPVRPVELVLGKYLGGLGIIGTTLGLTLVFPLMLSAFGSSESGTVLEWPTVLLGYGAVLLWGATCMAVGMFISSLTESQMVASLLTFAVLLPWMLLRGVAQGVEEPMRSFLGYLAFDCAAAAPAPGRAGREGAGVLPLRHPLLAAAHPPHGGGAALGPSA